MIDERILPFRLAAKQARRNGKRRVDDDSNVVGILSSDYIDRGDGLLIGLDTFTAANRHLLLPKTCPVSSDSLPRIIHFRYSYAKLRIHPTDEYNSLPLTALRLCTWSFVPIFRYNFGYFAYANSRTTTERQSKRRNFSFFIDLQRCIITDFDDELKLVNLTAL